MRPAVPEPPLADRHLFAALLALIAWLPLPWGSHVPWAGWLIGFVAALLLALWLGLAATGRVVAAAPPGLRWPLLAWTLWIAWILAQLVPLAPSTLARLSPLALELHRAVAAAGGEPFHTLSIAPSRTVDALGLTLAYFCLYWLVVLTAGGRPQRLRAVLLTILVAGVAQALYGSLMVLSKLEYGFLDPKQHYLGSATGTFINRNHFANYLALAAAAGVGLILADLRPGTGGRRSWRGRLSDFVTLLLSDKLRVRLALAILVIGVVLSRSRMGNLALFGSLCACGLAFVVVRERALAMRAAILFLSLVLVDVLIVSRWFGLEQVVERLEQTDVSREGRARLLDELPPVLRGYAVAGAGLGNFEPAYEMFRSARMRDYFDHAHNDYAELAIDVGVPGLAILLALAGLHLVHAIRVVVRRRRRLPAAVCFATVMALAASAVHATVEFNLQIPANAATLVVLLALAAGCSAQRSARRSPAAAPVQS